MYLITNDDEVFGICFLLILREVLGGHGKFRWGYRYFPHPHCVPRIFVLAYDNKKLFTTQTHDKYRLPKKEP